LDWNDIGVDRGVIYVLHRWTGPNTFVEVYRGDALTYTDEGLSANTTYDYFIYASVNGGTVWDDEASATTPVRPIVSDDTGAMLCASSGTYAGPGADVGDWKLRATNYRLYTGYFDSTYASQHSGAIWNIPANVRNCISIDRVDVSFRVQHAPYAPDDWGLVMQFNTTWPGTWPSSSGQFRYLRCNGKDTWLGGTEWVTITSNNVPGYGTVAECFRTRNAQGIGLVANTTVSTYGYVNHATAPTIRPRLRIWYTRNA
jgi:hypothetical protein